MMRLTTNNIRNVREHTKDGKTYSWSVVMKSGWVSDIREYINYVDGKTTADIEYPAEWLPKSVQKFIAARTSEMFYCNDDGYALYIYR